LARGNAMEAGVAQICNLPYRRIAFCGRGKIPESQEPEHACRLQIGDTADYKSALRYAELHSADAAKYPRAENLNTPADYKSAIRQITNLRYDTQNCIL